MKNKLLIVGLVGFGIFAANARLTKSPYFGSTANGVWDEVTSNQYAELPHQKISYASLFGFFKNKIKASARRTLNNRQDILPDFRKLAHPNGVCLKGTWKISEDNKYSGYFKNGSEATIIARASTAMSNTEQGMLRAFGMAGKLFPTTEDNKLVKTANFFLVDDLGGTKANHYTDVGMLNEPKVSKTTDILLHAFYALKLAITFGMEDSNPNMRQLYEVSELGESKKSKIITPKWMMIKAKSGQTVDEKDFRDELNVQNYNNNLSFDIFVSSTKDKNENIQWKKIGDINFNESSASHSCDHRLHFHHPKWKSNLKH